MASSPNTANVFSTNGIQQAPSAGGHSGPQLSPGQDLPRPTYGLPLDSTVVRARLPIDEQKEQGWRYYGYPAFATWTASSKDSFVIRRFSKLNSRILLRLQDEIAHLEEMLDNIDNHCITRFEKIDNGTFRDDKVNDRRQVLDQLTLKLKFFNEYIASYAPVRNQKSAHSHEIQNVKTWLFDNNPLAINPQETRYIEKSGDLISLSPKQRTPLRRLLDLFDGFIMLPCFRLQKKKWTNYHEHYDQDANSTIYTNGDRMDAFVTFTIVNLGLGMLIGPLWILHAETSVNIQLATISGFIVLFCGLLTSATIARPFETLGATAAYAAVLMVFVQVLAGQPPSK